MGYVFLRMFVVVDGMGGVVVGDFVLIVVVCYVVKVD